MNKYILCFLVSLTLWSCARVGSPVGGKKDSIAPRLVGSNIDSARINVPVMAKELRLDFDEYVTLKDVQKNLIISPPIKYSKIIPTTLGNRYVLIKWKDSLQSNTTYNFNFGNSIADLNEGNILPYFNFAFSTGEKLDDIYISGDAINGYSVISNKKDSKANYVVGLYKASDSIDYSKKPYYITKADADGYFELNYLSKGKYRLIAFDDQDQNSIFTPGKEDVYFDDNDIDLQANISGFKVKLFPSRKKVKFVESKINPGGILLSFEGKPENVEVTTENEKLKDFKVTHKKYSDTVNIWFNPAQLGLAENQSENIRFSYIADTVKGNTSIYYRPNEKDEFTISNGIGAVIPPERDFKIVSTRPLTEIKTDKWVLSSDSIAQDFTAKISELNDSEILVNSNFVPGKKYKLLVLSKTVNSYYEQLPKPYEFNFEIGKPENYGILTIKLKSKPESKFWMQLLDEQGKVQYSQYTDQSEVTFNMLKPAKYYVRILADNNGNETWDEADFSQGIHAEDAYVYAKQIEIRPLWTNVEDKWDPLDPNSETNAGVAKKPAPKESSDKENLPKPELEK